MEESVASDSDDNDNIVLTSDLKPKKFIEPLNNPIPIKENKLPLLSKKALASTVADLSIDQLLTPHEESEASFEVNNSFQDDSFNLNTSRRSNQDEDAEEEARLSAKELNKKNVEVEEYDDYGDEDFEIDEESIAEDISVAKSQNESEEFQLDSPERVEVDNQNLPSMNRTTSGALRTLAQQQQVQSAHSSSDDESDPRLRRISGSESKKQIQNTDENEYTLSVSKYRKHEKESDSRYNYQEDVPETGSINSQIDMSIGEAQSDNDSFFHDDDHKGGSVEFNDSDYEISGSHHLDQYDYSANAMPQIRKHQW